MKINATCDVHAASTLDRSPARIRDPEANDLDRLAADLDGLALGCCEPGVEEAGEQITRESVGEQQRFSEAARVHGEQLQRLVRLPAETTFLRGRCSLRSRLPARPNLDRWRCGLLAGRAVG